MGLQVAPGEPLAAADAAGLAYQQVATIRSGLADRAAFADQLAAPAASVPAAADAGCAARTWCSPSWRATAGWRSRIRRSHRGSTRSWTTAPRQLTAAGFTSRSAFLTSPTFGGISWLAHSTVQSGRWVDSQQRYDQLMASDRPTLTSTFGQAGWRTVLDVPANTHDWPEATSFYRADQVYDARTVGYRRPVVRVRHDCPTSTPWRSSNAPSWPRRIARR